MDRDHVNRYWLDIFDGGAAIMSLRTLLNRATYDGKYENALEGAEVIPLRAFDPVKSADRIKDLARQTGKVADRLANERKSYEETIAVLEAEHAELAKQLADERQALKDWCDHHMEADDE